MKAYSCTLATSATAGDALGIETASASGADGRDRVTWGADSVGRGMQVTIAPQDATSQFVLHAVAVVLIPSQAGPEDI